MLNIDSDIELNYETILKNEINTPLDFLKNILTIIIKDETNKRIFLALSNSADDLEIQPFQLS